MSDHPFDGGDQLKRFVSIGYFPVPAYCFTDFVLYPDELGNVIGFPTLGELIAAQRLEPDAPIIIDNPPPI